ncbi:MAG: ABC transporter ATP-binding protein [Chloroflexota bacterium]|nr:ABC transporter ATP-binding protein [Chloroflexota bacterium]
MLRLIKYIKPYILLVLAAIGLLFLLANADLALPDYLSRIVNIGIQQSGIDSSVPQAIRQSEMDKMALFFDEEEQTLVDNAYQLIDQDAEDFNDLQDTYPILSDEPVYLLKDLTKSELENLDPIMSKGMLILFGITQMDENPDQAGAMLGDLPFDTAQLPEGVDVFTLLQMAPAAQMEQIREQIIQQFDQMEDTLLEQMTAQAIKSEYQAIGMDLGNIQTNYILRVGGMMVLLALVSGIANICVSYLASRTSASVARDIRKDVFTKVESFSSQEFNNFSTASLITRATNDVTQIQQVVFMIMRMAFFAPLLGIGSIIRAIDKSPNMWWIIALAVGASLLLIIVLFFIAIPKFKIIQKLIDRLNLVTRESLSGMLVIRAFNKQKFEEERFDHANRELADVSLFINRVMATMMPIMLIIMNGLSILIIWVGAQQIAQSTLQVGDMMAFIQYSMQIMYSFLMVSMLFIFLPRSFISGDRIAEVLESENIIKDPEEPKSFNEPFKGKVEFKNVYFRYPDAEEYILKDISFTTMPGEITAIIGSTGCGKSTVVNLIPRFFDVNQGTVLVDDIDIRDVRQYDLRERIGYTPQRGILFTGTVESNLQFADQNTTDETLRESLEIAQATDFVFADPDGLQAEISQGGSNVSGGQKQRLSIARSLVKKPPIFIFDDSFSALDFKTDAALRKALNEKTGDSTVLLVTQRVATVKTADQIIVLENGEIVGKGTHHDLMETCQTYQEIATSQLSKEELA